MPTCNTMTDRDQRLAEFRELFAALPGPRNADRVRQATELAGVQPNTVRTWLMAEPPRVPTRQALDLWRARTVKSAA